jgi:hypothetical protein
MDSYLESYESEMSEMKMAAQLLANGIRVEGAINEVRDAVRNVEQMVKGLAALKAESQDEDDAQTGAINEVRDAVRNVELSMVNGFEGLALKRAESQDESHPRKLFAVHHRTAAQQTPTEQTEQQTEQTEDEAQTKVLAQALLVRTRSQTPALALVKLQAQVRCM